MSYQTVAAGTEGSQWSINVAATNYQQQPTLLTWIGLVQSPCDGYEPLPDQPAEEFQQFTTDTSEWPHQISWGNNNQSWIRVLVPTDGITQFSLTQTTAGTGGQQYRAFNFYYRWTGNYPAQYPDYQDIDLFTVEFEPILRDQEIAPETFMKWLEKIGHDDAFLRVSYKMQKKMMKATGHKPPWDPRSVEDLEEKRQQFYEHVRELKPETQEEIRKRNLERYGVEEIPPITPELLTQIETNSRQFLEECLSPKELKFFDEEGHLKIKSLEHNNIFYVIEKKTHAKIQRWVNGEHIANVCYHSKWKELPLFDKLAMKVLDIKYNEEEFLRIGNITKVRKPEALTIRI